MLRIKTGGQEAGDRSGEPSLEWSRQDGKAAAPSNGSHRVVRGTQTLNEPVGLAGRLDVGGGREEPGMTPRVLALMTERVEGSSVE